MSIRRLVAVAVSGLAMAACGGGSGTEAPAASGTLTLALTDGPMQAVTELVVRVDYLELHHADGRSIRLQPAGAPADVDLASLHDGRLHDLVDRSPVPAGSYHGLTVGLEPAHSHVGFADGSQHPMRFAAAAGLEVDAPFHIAAGAHAEFVIDVDIARSLQLHHGGMHGGMGGAGDYYELHSGVRMIDVATAGGLVGTVDPSLVAVDHPDCDPVLGRNRAYLFPAQATEPDDIAEVDADGRSGPLATDEVELHAGSGDYRYHFAFLEPGSYRVAFTCTGEWDEAGDEDYPADPDGRFGFQAFSAPAEVIAGQVTVLDLAP